jgi:uncharacterized protein (DUF983 family)
MFLIIKKCQITLVIVCLIFLVVVPMVRASKIEPPGWSSFLVVVIYLVRRRPNELV